ncbi:MAG: sulfite exporter TauE/SafE family protein [Deltaproteobacteria bacterium]|nr:MAG: sulfite exporter TauE/SafE family protein [Deltaproteobacteria bacterium]
MAVPFVALPAAAPLFGAEAALVGAGVGLLVGLTSMGAGALLTPALVLLLGVPPRIAVGSDVLIAGVMKLFGGGAYAVRRAVHWPTVLRLLLGSIPGALAGLWLLRLASGAVSLVRYLRRMPDEPVASPGAAGTAAIGFATGLLVSITTVGSGSILIFVLARFFPLRARQLVGTDLAHAFLLSVVAAAGHGFAGRLDPALAVAVLAGAVPGVIAGALLAGKVPERSLRTALATIVFTVGVRFTALPAAMRHEAPVALREVHR